MEKESHGKLPDPDEETPSFFAEFLPEFHSETLKIPSDIVKQGTNTVILSSSSREGEWYIDIYEFGNNVFFSNGWEKFVQDHDLHANDFLLFEYDGGMRFSVKTFQENGMEKDDHVSHVRNTNKKESRSKRTILDQQQGLGKDSNHHKMLSESASVRLPSSRRDYDIVQRKARSFYSQNPYFWRLLKSYNVKTNYALSIQKSMIKNLIPENTGKVTLKNSEGKAWEVKMTDSKGQVVLTSGWKSFVVENSLKVDDACIFELVGETEFQVHIY